MNLGKLFEHWVRGGLATSPEILAQWTQPGFAWAGYGSGWYPARKGWPDLNLFCPEGRCLQVEVKAVDARTIRHRYRWSIDFKLRRDRPEDGHQIAYLDKMRGLGHQAGVLLGRWHEGAAEPWVVYAIPLSVDFARPSIPWSELARFEVPLGTLWWELLGGLQ